ncbi:hypothetical protein ACJJTC_011928 [Scirpophaga incertulas]
MFSASLIGRHISLSMRRLGIRRKTGATDPPHHARPPTLTPIVLERNRMKQKGRSDSSPPKLSLSTRRAAPGQNFSKVSHERKSAREKMGTMKQIQIDLDPRRAGGVNRLDEPQDRP